MTIAFMAGIWLVAMSSIAIHESIKRPSASYRSFVKWFSGLSIVAGLGLLTGTTYFVYQKKRGI